MRCLLIGGAGFIGSNIIRHLLEKPTEDKLFVLEPDFASTYRLDNLNVTLFRGEISNLDLVKSIIIENNIDTVIHLVSSLIPASNFDDYQREFTNIIFPSIRLMELCCERNIKFVYFSSGGTIYGDKKGEVSPFKESDPMAPISYYGWSKQMMENSILYMNRTQHLRYVIIRPSNPYGKGQNLHGKQGLIAVALGKIMAGESIQIWGDGKLVRDYIYIDDLGKAVVNLLANDSIVNETINIGSGVGYSINEIVEVLRSIVKEKVNVDYIEARQVDVSSVILDINKLRNLISFCPINIKDGITQFYHDVKMEYN
jgi:UDP-glucose 4-epimerase